MLLKNKQRALKKWRAWKITLWISKPLTVSQVVHILRELFKQKCRLVGDRIRPAISIDASLVAITNIGRSCGPLGAVSIIAREFAAPFVDSYVVADGPIRHHSKRATIKRAGDRERAKI